MATNEPNQNAKNSPSSDVIHVMRALGFNGSAFTLISIALGAFTLVTLHRYLLDQFFLFAEHSQLGKKQVFILSVLISALTWSAFLPVLLVLTFLPLRSAWIDGQVSLSTVLRQSIDALRRTVITLRLTVSGLAFSALPLIGALLLWRECFRRDATAQITIIMGIFTILLAIGSLWRAIAIISATPLVILAQCSPFSAIAECRVAITHSYRARLLVDFIIWGACIGAGFYLQFYSNVDLWLKATEFAGILAAIFLLGTDFGVTCFKALALYANANAAQSAPDPKQYIMKDESAYSATAISSLPNGQPVTIHIENLHLSRKN